MAEVTGARGTGSLATGLLEVDMSKRIYELDNDAAPLTVLSAKLGNQPTHNPEFSWWEDDREPRFDAIDGTTGTGTSITVDNGSYFAEHDIVKVPRTGELFRVVAVAGNVLTVVRGVGGSAVAVANNDELIIIGSAQPEGDTSKPARTQNPTKTTNYTQITRTPWESTETLVHSNTVTSPSDWNRMAAKKGVEHKVSQEYVHWHGKPSVNTSGSQPRRTTGGAFHFISTNATDAGGALTEQELFTFLRGPFRYGSKTEKVLFASPLVVDVINGFPRGKLELVQSDNDQTYGLNVRRLVSPHGTVSIVTNYLFEGTTYGGYAVLLDMSNIKRRHLANSEGSRDTHVRMNIQPPDADTRKNEYLTESGLEFAQEASHGYLYGVTS